MRAYAPATWAQLAQLDDADLLPGPLRACAVDPAWRAAAPDVDEEQWEFEAQSAAAAALDAGGDSAGGPGGVVLALDAEPGPGAAMRDGWVDLAGPVRRDDLAAVLSADLAWYGVQEIGLLLDLSRGTGR